MLLKAYHINNSLTRGPFPPSRKENGMDGLKKEQHLFEKAHIAEAILSLALPAVMGQIILVIYNMADTFFVGLTGSDAMITAVTVCMPAFMFLSAIANLFGVGGASVIARALGNRNAERARDTASFALWGCLITAAAYSAGAFIFKDSFINLLGGSDPQVHRHAVEYLLCTVVAGGVVTSVNTLLSHLIRSEGRSMQSSTGIAIGGVLNIALDPLFMFVLLPAGKEALGAALATALSNVVTLIYFIIAIRRNRPNTTLCFAPRRAMLSASIPADVLSTGVPACLMTLCENISYGVLDNLMALYGTAAQAGIGVAKKVNMLAHCMVRGMAQGVLPLIAYNYAAGDYKRMRSAVLTSTAISACLAGLCTAANLCFTRELIGVFIRGGESMVYGMRFLRILCIGAPFSACAYAFISFFQATGHGRHSLVLALLRKGILDIPLMFILKELFPIYGIVWATPAADMICCAAATAIFAVFMGRFEEGAEPEEGSQKGKGLKQALSEL